MGRKSKSKRQRKARETRFQAARGSTVRPGSSIFRRRVLVTWFLLACLITIGGAYSHFGRPVRVKLGANLRSFDRLQLSYAGIDKKRISPLCGCWKEQAAETWRGITFATRRLILSRSGPTPLTAYVVMSPWPARMHLGGPWMALAVKPFGPIASSFDPLALLDQFKGQSLAPSSTNIITSVQYGILVTDQPLHVRQFGDTPLGAWIPMGASTISILPQLRLFPSSANTVDITESYQRILTGIPRQPSPDSLEPAGAQSNAELPALDLLGKRTIIWSEGPNASVWLSETGMTTLELGKAGSAVGLVIDPAFSARITVIPTSREVLARFAKIERDQMLPQPQDWLAVSETGSISLRLERSVEELKEFDAMAERLKIRDKVENVSVEYPRTGSIDASGEPFFTYESHTMNFRYPPSPPARGFNVFGQMAHLEFEGVTGSVVIGSRVVEIPAPSTLDFRDIESFKAARGLIPVSVSGAGETLDTTLTFSGISEAWLNGEPLTRIYDRFSWSVGFIALIAGIVQAIAAAFGMTMMIIASRRGQTP